MQPPAAPTGLQHIALLARNLEPTVQFYRDLLGFQILDQPVDAADSLSDQVWLGLDQRPILTITAAPDAPPGQLGIGEAAR